MSENLQISITKIIACTLPVYIFYRTQINKLLKRWKNQKKSKKSSKKTMLEALSGKRAFFRSRSIFFSLKSHPSLAQNEEMMLWTHTQH